MRYLQAEVEIRETKQKDLQPFPQQKNHLSRALLFSQVKVPVSFND